MNKYNIEYKDWSDFGCGQIIEGKDSKDAVQKLQLELIKENDLMTKLVYIREVLEEEEEENGE